MAYRDPYAEPPSRLPQPPSNNEQTDYNHYSTSHPHHTYEHDIIGPSYDAYGSGYRDELQYDSQYPPQRSQTLRHYNGATGGGLEPPSTKETNLEAGPLASRQQKTARALRNYRYVHQGALWTKGGRGRCAGRFFCCTIMIAVLLFVSIVLALALWIRPPNITIGNVDTISKGGSAIQLIDNGISVNLGVNITVNNPNYFDVNLKQIKAEIFYPINGKSPQIGQGISNNVVFHSNQQTNWTFPFAINYRKTDDPDGLIVQDLASKCGVDGAPKRNINVNYKISLSLRILFITVSPVISNAFDFVCPIDPSELKPFLNSGLGGL